MTITVDIQWPDTIPLPLLDYGGMSRAPLLVTPASSVVSQRRSRFKTTYQSVQVQWCLKVKEWNLFQTFWNDTLGQGTAKFQMDVRYPKDSGNKAWLCQFNGAFAVEYSDGNYMVSAEMELVMPVEISDPAAVISG